NHNDFCEWVKCKKKKKSFFESPESHLNNNKQYFRLKDLDKKLHNYAVQIKSKEDSVKSNALNDALNQPINGESDKSTTDIYLKALKED
ncbi:MAG: hypothetical protein KKA79_02465, partial [Nanoarchaeota archaeon]|nr:hypothetical protein [Nanoarchaeota archaeon]